MGTYLLKENEVEVRVAIPSWLMLLLHIAFSLVTFGVWLPVLIYYILRRATTRYIVTNQRIILEYGILNKSSKESPLDKINNVSHTQSILGRIFNYGDVQLQTASEMGATMFKFIPDPSQFKSEIVNQMDLFKKGEVQAQAKIMANAMKDASTPVTNNDDLKACPKCAESVKIAASICRYCNFAFE